MLSDNFEIEDLKESINEQDEGVMRFTKTTNLIQVYLAAVRLLFIQGFAIMVKKKVFSCLRA